MRILITGAVGQLGSDLVPLFPHHDVASPGRRDLDIGDRSSVLAAVHTLHPDLVINLAAMTAVDACEEAVDDAFRINAMGPRNLSEAAAGVGAHLVHVSTDYVFDGTKTAPYHEWDEPAPASVYGHSKRAGELECAPGATIVRTSWVCGAGGANMVKTILRLAAEHETLRFVSDQRGHPTFTEDLAAMIHRLAIDRRPGLFHVTNQRPVSWFEFAREVLESSGQDPSRVEPIVTSDLDPPRPAPRPANSVLENRALALSGLDLLADFRQPLDRLVTQLVES